jgi:DNA repair protein RecN (Recombination protein N)
MLRALRIENLVLIREADLRFGSGLNVITGETGAGKTILAQAVGLLLGEKGNTRYVGSAGSEAYVEAELDLPLDVMEDDGLPALAELRPEGEEGLVLARRVFMDGRTRAYAWGRSAPREDVAAVAEQLLAMSGQFEQRRLARSAYQLDVLDGFVGHEQAEIRSALRLAWKELAVARRRYEELSLGANAAEARVAELRALVADTEGLEAGLEDSLRAERERLRHVTELLGAAATALAALDSEEGDGAAGLTAAAESAISPVETLAPELARAGDDLRDAELRLRETATALRRFAESLESDPGRLEQVESQLDRIADTRRRFGCQTFDELLARADEARVELAALEEGVDPVAAAHDALAVLEVTVRDLARGLRLARSSRTDAFAEAVATELRGVGLGEGDFRVELQARELGPTGEDEASFLIRPNPGLPFSPVAETASGGELSRIALAIASVSGGETLLFDEIDAGIGGQAAHAVAETLAQLATRAQVITITHLPQIASRADRHFAVEKIPGDPTVTQIRELDDDERRSELERMLGGREFLAALQE